MALLSILSKDEIKSIYDIPELIDDERGFLFSLDEDDQIYIDSLKDNVLQKINYILQLGYHLATGNFFRISFKKQQDDFDFIVNQYFPNELISIKKFKHNVSLSKRHHYANRKALIKKFGLKEAIPSVQEQLKKEARALAKRHVMPKFVMQELLSYCLNYKIIRPAYSTMQNLVSDSLNAERKRLCNRLYSHSNKTYRDNLDKLLQSEDLFYNLTLLKQDQKSFSTTEIKRAVAKQQMIKEAFEQSKELIAQLKILEQNLIYYANLAEFYTIGKLKQFKHKNQARLYLLCYVHRRLLKINNHLIISFNQKVNGYTNTATQYQKEQINVIETADTSMRKQACRILDLNINDDVPDDEVRNSAFKIVPKEKYKTFLNEFRKPNFNRDYHRWNCYGRMAGSIKRNVRPIFKVLDFSCSQKPLVDAVEFLKNHLEQNKPINKVDISDVPLDFFPKTIQKLIVKNVTGDDGMKHKFIDSDRYEFMVYSQLQQQIKKGGAFIKDSITFRSLEDELIDIEYWHKNKHRLLKELNMPLLTFDIISLIEQFESVIEKKYKEVNLRIGSGENKHIKLKRNLKGDITGWRLPYVSKNETINHSFYDRLPVSSVADILRFTNEQTGFIKAFTHIQPKYSKIQVVPEFIFASTLANATGIQVDKMKAISDIKQSDFVNTSNNFIRQQTLEEARDAVAMEIEKLPVFEKYTHGDYGIHASVDGQKLTTKFNTIKSRYSKKYFGLLKGVVIFSLNANHLPLNLKVIAANEHESHHLLDVVENQSTDIDIKAVSGDMHSINRVNFALMHFFGYRFMPRFTKLESKVNNSLIGFGNSNRYSDMLIKPTKKIDKKLIIGEWDNVLRILVSLAMKKTTQHQVIRKLSSFKANSTFKALMALDEIVMTDYLLDYIDSHEIRQNVQSALNRGEAYHQLSAAIAKVSGNKALKGKNETQLDVNAQAIRLIAMTIIYYNAYMLSSLYEFYQNTDKEKALKIIRFSPVTWQHINLIGKYEFYENEKSIDIQSLIRILGSRDEIFDT